jgi:hypothetical protein
VLRFFVLGAVFFASTGLAEARNEITDKASCYASLSRFASIVGGIRDVEGFWHSQYAALEDRSKADALVNAHVEIRRQNEIIAELLSEVCQTYD